MITKLLSQTQFRGSLVVRNPLFKKSHLRNFSTDLSEKQFLKLWDEIQEEFLNDLENEKYGPIEDYQESAETVTVEVSKGRYFVLSRHSGNKEIW